MKFLSFFILLLVSACAPFPSNENRLAFVQGRIGHVSLDTSDLGNTPYRTIFTDVEPLVNNMLHSLCFATDIEYEQIPMDIFQGNTHEWIKGNVKDRTLVRRYIVSQTRTIKIEVQEDIPGVMAQTTISGGTITFSGRWLAGGSAMRYISEVTTHEIMHTLGFGHNEQGEPVKTSVPYRAGTLASGICYEGDGL